MKLLAFLESCPNEAVRVVTEAYTAPDARDLEAFLKSYKANYMKAGWREVLGIIETNEVPAELIAGKFEDIRDSGFPAQVILRPGFTKETVLQTFALGLINVVLHTVLENGYAASDQNPLTLLQMQIDLAAKIWKHVKTRSGNERVITLEEENRLREALASSIIDSEALIAFLKDPQKTGIKPSTGQYI